MAKSKNSVISMHAITVQIRPPAKLKTESCCLPFELESPLKPELEFMTLLNSKILLGFSGLGWAYLARSGSQTKLTGIRFIYSPAITNLFT